MLKKDHQSIKSLKVVKTILVTMFSLSFVGCNWYIPYENDYNGLSSLAQGGVIEATGYSVIQSHSGSEPCLLYTSDAADE